MKLLFRSLLVFVQLVNPWRTQEIVATHISEGKKVQINRNNWNELLHEKKSELMSWRKALTSFDFHIRQAGYSKNMGRQARDFASQSQQNMWHLDHLLKNCTFEKKSDQEVLQGLRNNFQETTTQLLESADWLENPRPPKYTKSE